MTQLKNIKISLLFLSLVLAFAACKSNDKTESRDIQLMNDTSVYHNNASSDTSRKAEVNAVPLKGNIHNNHVSNNGGHANSGNSANSGSSSSGNTSSSNSGNVSNSGSSSTPASTKKKGWSKAAQGAVIGGAAGAVGGAIISKKKGTGAAIGGVVGAAGGYIIGRGKDKKDGRVK